ncbi:MAG: helix-turn-helix domain-containing protein [Acidimicrobiales bacterium]
MATHERPPAGARPEAGVAEAKREAVSGHIVDAASRLVGAQGIDVTMDQIAEAAGVSRRTVFRHFQTRENLLAAACASTMRRYGERLPPFEGDWRSWLHDTCQVAHAMNTAFGPGYWELLTRTDLPDELAALERARRTVRRRAMRRIAATLWTAAGGQGATPPQLVACVGAHLSAHFSAAVATDVGGTAADAARLGEAAILAALAAEGAVVDDAGSVAASPR